MVPTALSQNFYTPRWHVTALLCRHFYAWKRHGIAPKFQDTTFLLN
jgi:hypothetical protein